MYFPKTRLQQVCFVLLPFFIAQSAVSAEPSTKMSMGNGDENWIITTGVQRQDSTLTFKEVHISGNGWLVMHPFENGAPNGDKYVASSFVKAGGNKDVKIKVHKGIEKDELFIVMLHQDSNHNEIFDFVFVDDINVMDKAVFEGSKMIGHVFKAP
ncbi:MAG: hypothetical protein ACI9CE_000213 [Flavobacterium sp.]|jgi:hypothetical protein